LLDDPRVRFWRPNVQTMPLTKPTMIQARKAAPATVADKDRAEWANSTRAAVEMAKSATAASRKSPRLAQHSNLTRLT
jgi:hypothetical protein